MPELEQNIVYEIQQLNGDLLDVQNASDYNLVINWIDISSVDQRPSTLVHSSVTLSKTVTETITWAGTSGNYYVTQITIS